jgi:hypothetical protein
MLEYTQAGDGMQLSLLILHDDEKREYAYGPAKDYPIPRLVNLPKRCTITQEKTAGFLLA